MIIWMIFIFIMSNTNGNDSSSQSNFFANIILQFINIDKETLTFLIRKLAHMSEYAILALFTYYALIKIAFNKRIIFQITFLISFLYACSDEFHQLFISGRSGQFTDIIIDSTGCLIMLLFLYLWQKRKNESNDY
ncbi:VanZ family protein [Erysipelatoclostridium sp. An173]|uniref:VanZ family protein n=1 Tax=Erysipelatoclostridium sp. An173 TaxID=1965571 RepID=UPI002101B887|nr:VanZ family protein [Erysipelatoclostridium sp. An173]